MIHDVCDHCRRGFGWTVRPIICPNCGVENLRPALIDPTNTRETTTLEPAQERAVLATPEKKKKKRKR
jgi:hypothetical protein